MRQLRRHAQAPLVGVNERTSTSGKMLVSTPLADRCGRRLDRERGLGGGTASTRLSTTCTSTCAARAQPLCERYKPSCAQLSHISDELRCRAETSSGNRETLHLTVRTSAHRFGVLHIAEGTSCHTTCALDSHTS